MKEEGSLEVLLKLGIRLAGLVGGGIVPYTVAYYALGQPSNLYHSLWLTFGDLRDFVMIGASTVTMTAGFIGALYLTENFKRKEKRN